MPNCENCLWLNELRKTPQENLDVAVGTAAEAIQTGLEKAVPNCGTWKTTRYLSKMLFPNPPVNVVFRTTGIRERLLPAKEEACQNPYRGTDDYLELRADLVDAKLAAIGIDPDQFPTARTMPQIAAHMQLIKDQINGEEQ